MSLETVEQSGKSKKYMLLKVGGLPFAVALTQVREVLGLGHLSNVPNMPSYFAGLINLRGKIISAVYLSKSISQVMKSSIEASKRPCVVIVEVPQGYFGAIVDDVLEVQSIPNEMIDRSLESLSHGHLFEGLIKKQGEDLAPILNLQKALRIHELVNTSAKAS